MMTMTAAHRVTPMIRSTTCRRTMSIVGPSQLLRLPRNRLLLLLLLLQQTLPKRSRRLRLRRVSCCDHWQPPVPVS